MERCEHYTQLLSARLDGELTEIQTRELEAHLANCPDCQALAGELEALRAAFAGLEEVPAPEGFAEGVMSRIRAEEKPKVVHLFQRSRFKVLVGLSACALVCVGLYHFGGVGQMNMAQDGAVLVQAAEGSAAVVEKREVQVQFAGSSELYDAASSQHRVQNDQYFRVSWQEELEAPTARILGSVDSLQDILSQFPEDLSAVSDRYGEDFFQTGRLLALIVTESSGSVRHELEPQGLLRDQVTVLRQVPEAGTADMAAWLILAEVDNGFEDGDVLDVILKTK